MPTIKDKQNLQKHYYLELFKNSKEVKLLYLKGKMANFSREIGLKIDDELESRDEVLLTLFPPHQTREYQEDKVNAVIPSDMNFSSTSLKMFKECKRKFYFFYLRGFKTEENQEDKKEQGVLIHQILHKAYQEIEDFSHIKNAVMGELFKLQEDLKDNHRLQMQYRILTRDIQKFLDLEATYPPSEILSLEESFDLKFEEYKLTGKVDRIDRMGDEIRVIDYKYTSKEKKSEKASLAPYKLQAAIYYLHALRRFGSNVGVYFGILKDGEYRQCDQGFLEEGIEELRELLSQVHQEREFSKTDKHNTCRECAYKILCNR